VSERHACRIVSQPRGTQRYIPTVRVDEDVLTKAVVTLASEYGRYGYRRITALLRSGGTPVGEVCRKLGVSEQSFYRWKKQFAGMRISEIRRLKLLEDENTKLKRLVADLTLDKTMLQDALRKKW
jgi:putative transposase